MLIALTAGVNRGPGENLSVCSSPGWSRAFSVQVRHLLCICVSVQLSLSVQTCCRYVTLDHKTSNKGRCVLDLYIYKLSIYVWVVRIGPYLGDTTI